MKKWIIALLALLITPPAGATGTPTLARTSTGAVQGVAADGVRTFIGIPYAAPPVGALRFKAPQPHAPWPQVLDCTKAGATAPPRVRPLPMLDVFPIVGHGWVPGDDYVTLNVWAPEKAEKRPVMVFIHGGALVLGNKDAPVYDGRDFARSGVLCVTLNYRLGIEGFLPIPGAPTNLGLRDMLAALRWVQANIAQFGGDPANVTLFGESGGAMAATYLVASPLATGLFQRAIVQSGHGSSTYSLAVAQRLVVKIAHDLAISPDVAGFSTTAIDRCLQAQEKVAKLGAVDLRNEQGIDPGFGVGRFAPVYGDDLLPEPPLELIRKGAAGQVPLLITTTAQEANIFTVPYKLQRYPGFVAKWFLRKSMPKQRTTDVLKAYGLGRKGKRGGEILSEALTDLAFRWPARLLAQAHTGRTHVLEFDWQSNACGGKLGACHSVDLPLVFNTTAAVTGPNELAGTAPPTELAAYAHALWVNFATDGRLPWPEFTSETRQVFQLTQKKARYEPVLPAATYYP